MAQATAPFPDFTELRPLDAVAVCVSRINATMPSIATIGATSS